MQKFSTSNSLVKFATILFILYGIYYIPIDGRINIGPVKLTLVAISLVTLLTRCLYMSKAMVVGTIYLIFQYLSASFHPESWRWSTLLYSTILVYTYVCFYNMVTITRVFTIEYFIKLCKWIMLAYFIVCVTQQAFLLVGIKYMPIVNLCQILNRGIGCNSLCQEPSTFGRFMLVFYYAYIKCSEYKRGEGPFSVIELFSGEHKWITIRFLWMMLTMGSGTAFICLLLFTGYFVRRHNWYYMVPILALGYSLLQASGIEALDRATDAIEATSTLDSKKITKTDTSAAVRITPFVNSLNADFSKIETWVGNGIDASHKVERFSRTLFDDYGLIFYILTLLLNFTCAYNFWSLATIFMFAGVGGGSGTNIQYAWELMMVMTCVKYFHENRYNPEIYDEEEGDLNNENIETISE